MKKSEIEFGIYAGNEEKDDNISTWIHEKVIKNVLDTLKNSYYGNIILEVPVAYCYNSKAELDYYIGLFFDKKIELYKISKDQGDVCIISVDIKLVANINGSTFLKNHTLATYDLPDDSFKDLKAVDLMKVIYDSMLGNEDFLNDIKKMAKEYGKIDIMFRRNKEEETNEDSND